MFPFIFRGLAAQVGRRSVAQIVAPKVAAIVKSSGARGGTKRLIARLVRLQFEAESRGFSTPFSEEFAAQIGKEKANTVPRMLRDVQREFRSKGVAGDLESFAREILAERRTITDAKSSAMDTAMQSAIDGIRTHRQNIGGKGTITVDELEELRKGLPQIYADKDRLLDIIASNLQPEGTEPGELADLMRKEMRNPADIKAPRYTGRRVPILTATGSGKDLVFRQNVLTSIAGSKVSEVPIVAAILIENFLAMGPTQMLKFARENTNIVNVFFGGFTYNVGKGSLTEIMDVLGKYNGLPDWRTNPAYFVDPTDTSNPLDNFVNMYVNGMSITTSFGLTGVSDEKLKDYMDSADVKRNEGQGQESLLTRRPTAGFKPRLRRK